MTMRAPTTLDQQLFRRGQQKPPPLPADFGQFRARFDAADTEWLLLEARRRGISIQQLIRDCVAQARMRATGETREVPPKP